MKNRQHRSLSYRLFGAVFILFSVALVAVLAFAAGEYYVRSHYVKPWELKNGAAVMWWSLGNSYLAAQTLDDNCAWEDTLVAHPFLGWVSSSALPCPSVFSNNIGMPEEANYPYEKDPRYFTIAFLGGSVADMMMIGGNWLQDALSSRFQSPNGKPFRVLKGANGGWSYPVQLNFLNLYGDSIDAVVSLDGYNEFKPGGHPITRPDTDLFLYLTHPKGMGWTYDMFLSLRWLRSTATHSPILSQSFLLYFAYVHGVELAKTRFDERRWVAVDRFFEFPPGWTDERKAEWNRKKYETYIRQLKASADALGIRYAHFVQPIPQIGKTLTMEEKNALPNYFDTDGYLHEFVEPSEGLRRKGYFTYALMDVFKNETGRIYEDAIHFHFDMLGSRGNVLLAAAMAEEIGKAWKLRPLSGAKK